MMGRGLVSRLGSLPEEIRLIGPRAFRHRVRRELERIARLHWMRFRPFQPDDRFAFRGVAEAPGSDSAWLQWWDAHRQAFFIEGLDEVRGWMEGLSPAVREECVREGYRGATGVVRAFDAWDADFGSPPDWTLNPVRGEHWAGSAHGREVLTSEARARVGDIKFTWELGRFNHLPGVLRAFAAEGDPSLLDRLFEQLRSFESDNPVFQGPHWVSEQEVGIRTSYLLLLLHAVSGEPELTGDRFRLLIRQIVAGAHYCYAELDLAENCIRNNHLIAGALPLFLAGTLFPWHVDAAAWRHRGRQVLIEAIQEQWWNDGGYVQPSHTYHRLALSYLLWAARVAELHGDHEFVGKAKTQLRNGGALLYQMTDCSTGTLPNWGPNDGALFPPLGGSDYSDFRPILNAVGYATEGCRVFPEGPGDELMVWLWGMNALSAPERPPIQRSHSFPHAGLHILRSSEAHAVLRCGPVLSRYGQHADQLHVDVWWRGRNFLRDNGSYSYADPRFHEWFRSTDAHNTVVCDGRSQMEPHRQFLFLKWPSSRMLEMTEPPPGVLDWVGGLHTGYHRLDRVVTHTRILARLESARWLVVDKVSAALDGRPIPVDLRWHLIQGAIRLTDSEAKVMLDDGPYGLRWCATEETVASISEGSDSPVDGWASRYYGLKAPAPSLRIRARLDRAPLVMATLLGPSLEKHELILSEGKLTAGQVCLDLSDLLNSAP